MSLQQSPSAAARATTARARHAVRAEVLALSRLAAPMIPAQVGWMMLGLVDMWMVGKLGSAPLAAGAAAEGRAATSTPEGLRADGRRRRIIGMCGHGDACFFGNRNDRVEKSFQA